MKKAKATLLITGVLTILAGSCIPSLFPLYTEDDIVIDERIEGSWDGGFDNIGIWTIERLESHPDRLFMDPDWTEPDENSDPENIHYRLTVEQATEKYTAEAEFILHLLILGDHMYMNIYPHEYELDHDFLSWHMIEANTFMRVELFDDRLELRAFDPSFLLNLINANRIRISHVSHGGEVLLTAPTRDLQKFVMKYSDEEGALFEPDVLKKI